MQASKAGGQQPRAGNNYVHVCNNSGVLTGNEQGLSSTTRSSDRWTTSMGLESTGVSCLKSHIYYTYKGSEGEKRGITDLYTYGIIVRVCIVYISLCRCTTHIEWYQSKGRIETHIYRTCKTRRRRRKRRAKERESFFRYRLCRLIAAFRVMEENKAKKILFLNPFFVVAPNLKKTINV